MEYELEIAPDNFFAMADGEIGEVFAGGAAADGGVVLQLGAELKNCGVTRDQPAEAKAGEAVGFAHGAEADGALVEFATSGQASGRIVFQLAVDFITKNINAIAIGELHDAAQDRKRNEQAGGIVRGVDVDGASVRLDERFQCGKIVSPAVFGFAAPFAERGSGAFDESESAFVAGRFDDGMIAGFQ